jgi:hypothetical protein
MLARRNPAEGALGAAGLAVGALISANAQADTAAPAAEDKLQIIEVTGTAIHTSQDMNNVTDKLYFTSIYYVDIAENHALPAAGRTLIGGANYRF